MACRLRETGGVFKDATCLAIACPACMTMDLAQSCNSYVTTIINGHDMIPTLSPGERLASEDTPTSNSSCASQLMLHRDDFSMKRTLQADSIIHIQCNLQISGSWLM